MDLVALVALVDDPALVDFAADLAGAALPAAFLVPPPLAPVDLAPERLDAAALVAAVWVQVAWSDWGFGRAAAAAGCVALLGAYVLAAVRFPTRGPHDRVVGTYVVPV